MTLSTKQLYYYYYFLFLGFSCLYVSSSACDTGPHALTAAYLKNIPQTCIDVPVGDSTRERCFYTYVPETCAQLEISKAPLVLDVHGMGSCPLWSAGYTGWMQKAEEECIVVAWPTGNQNGIMPRCFNTPGFLTSDDISETPSDVTAMPCCCLDDTTFKPREEAYDPLFLKMVIDEVVHQQSNASVVVDSDRVYMAGHSNGCMISLAMAAIYSDTIAAVACHAGSLMTPFEDENYTPVPIMMVHGLKDDIVPYEGKTMFDLPGMGPLGFLPMNETMKYLGDQNECTTDEERDIFDQDGIVGRTFKKTNCKDGANIEVVTLFDAGHNPYSSPVLGDRTTVDTTAMAWDFCKGYSKGQDPNATTTTSTSLRLNEDKNDFASSGSLGCSISIGMALVAPLLTIAGSIMVN